VAGPPGSASSAPANPPEVLAAPPASVRGTGETYPEGPYAAALLVDDPPKIGDFWLDGRLAARASGIAYLAHEGSDPTPVMLVMLSEGAAEDPAARDRLAGEVNKMNADTVLARGGAGQGEGRLAGKFRSDDEDPIGATDAVAAPWVALAYDRSLDAVGEADRLLRSVDLSRTPALGTVAGPDFRLPWIQQTAPGRWRTWPLPWPGRKDRASWMTLLVSWLLMIVLAALALLIVVLIFQIPPPETPQPPVSGSTETSSQSQNSSESQSASGTPSDSPTGTDSPSASTTGSPSQSPSGSDSPSGSSSASPSGSGSVSPSGSGSPMSPTHTPSMFTSGPSGTGPQTPPQNTRL